MSCNYLSRQEIININNRVLRLGAHEERILSPGNLDQACEAPDSKYGGVCVYNTLESKCYAYAYYIASGHAFHDGNKRTATKVVIEFLRKNGIELDEEQIKEFEHLVNMLVTTEEDNSVISGLSDYEDTSSVSDTDRDSDSEHSDYEKGSPVSDTDGEGNSGCFRSRERLKKLRNSPTLSTSGRLLIDSVIAPGSPELGVFNDIEDFEDSDYDEKHKLLSRKLFEDGIRVFLKSKNVLDEDRTRISSDSSPGPSSASFRSITS